MRCRLLFCVFTLIFCFPGAIIQAQEKKDSSFAHSSSAIIVGNIFLEGNKKTKDAFLYRELPFKKGEQLSLSDLVIRFEMARRQLLNTTLFTEVVVAAKNIVGDTVDVLIFVKERWYVFPLPYFRPVDRNLNQWIVEQDASLERVNYGIKLYHNNATGNNDKLRLGLTGGYTKQLQLSYDRLYIDKAMKWGLKLQYLAGKNHEINYNTIRDKQAFFKDEKNYVRHFSNAAVQFTYRPAIKTRHSFGLGYSTEKVSDTVIKINPYYFKSGRRSLGFPTISYSLSYFDVDYIPYPTKGYAAEMLISKTGFNNRFNLWQLQIKALALYPVLKKTFISLNYFGGLKLPFKQPYYNQRLFGYGDVYMQGFEYYVVDGVAGSFLKTAVNRELLNLSFRTPPSKKNGTGQLLPFRIIGKIYGNTGYVHHPQPGENSLSNQFLWSGGIGIDIISSYDIIFKLEWSFNSLGQNGLFLHRKSNF